MRRSSAMLSVLPDGTVEPVASVRTRLQQRLARHLRTAPALVAPDMPLVSFTFDDAPTCACTTGAAMLDDHGAKGTYYISGGLIGQRDRYWTVADDAEIAALHTNGHEIGSHTYGHAFVPGLDRAALVAESRRNRDRLRATVPGLPLESFAFPYGFGSVTAKRTLAGLYRSSRGIVPGLNVGRTDLQFLRANPLMEVWTDPARIAGLMDAALARRAWLIFYGHDVVDRPSPYGCTPGLLSAALRLAGDRGIPCVTVAEGLRRALPAPSPADRSPRPTHPTR
ncbi:polysaccharide deacetylase family protein [Methylobacterium sp. Leaf112]|uniref:polysaccharide deacetylase family protein n=1 Tax=Methylobacterium sp. Leaf112 TaxID=1736258 RepID=UPI0006F44DE9|nr:polysaccharide deacetylase family protein [Methylobacterium sp. Leaf112]